MLVVYGGGGVGVYGGGGVGVYGGGGVGVYGVVVLVGWCC